jgi:iron complex outermembrane receptor protein
MSRFILLSGSALAALTAMSAPALADATTPLETVVVTASPIVGDVDRFATIVGVVDRDQILQSGGANLADALASVPGVSGSGFAAGASRPIIRGMDASRVSVLEDGTSSADVSDIGPDHGVPIDPLSAQRIEVVRGAATLRYGSQAIGGVVNAINNRVPMTLGDKPSAEVSSSYSSVADTGQLSALGDASSGNFAFHADGFYRHGDNYDTPLGTQANSFFRGDGGSLGSSYFFGDGSHVGAAIIHYDAKYGIPSDTTYINMRQTKVITLDTLELNSGALKEVNFSGSYANYSHGEDNPDGSINSVFKNEQFDGRAELLLDPIGPFSATAIGVQAQNRAYQALGEDSAYLYPTLTQSFAGFLFTEAPIGDSLHLQASGRIENIHVSGTPASDTFTKRDFTPLSGAVGILYDASDAVKLGLTASSTARAPGQAELFARGGHDGPQTFETGDPSLRMERANSLEGTLRLRYPGFTVDASAWASFFSHYIYGRLTGQSCDDDGVCVPGLGEELKELNYSQQGATFWGLEGKAAYHLLEAAAGDLDLNLMGDYVRATLADGLNVPRIPTWRIGGGLSWQGDAVDASTMLIYAGRQNDYGLYDTPTPSYVSLDAQVAWRPIPGNRDVELALVAHNLADTVQRDAASFNKDIVVMPGRDIRVVARWAF